MEWPARALKVAQSFIGREVSRVMGIKIGARPSRPRSRSRNA